MSRISRRAYEQMVKEDIEWLRQQPDTLERDHLEQIAFWSINAIYGDTFPKEIPQ